MSFGTCVAFAPGSVGVLSAAPGAICTAVGSLGDDEAAAAESADAFVSSSGRRVPVVRILPWVIGDVPSAVDAATGAVAPDAALEAPKPPDRCGMPTEAGVRGASAFARTPCLDRKSVV